MKSCLGIALILSLALIITACDEGSEGTIVDQSVDVTGFIPETGTGGQTLTATGNFIFDMASVTVGGQPCTDLNIADGSTVTCTIPAGTPGAVVDVVFEDRNGNRREFLQRFTYN